MDIESINYPDMNGIAHWANPFEKIPVNERLVGRTIYWETKRDGTNLKVFLDAAGQINVGTRNMTYASEEIRTKFMNIPEKTPVLQALTDGYDCTVNYVVFGELLMKGKSPARFEIHDIDQFEVFDVWNDEIKQWMPADERHRFCEKYGIKEVETLMVSYPQITHSLENIYALRNTLLDQCKKEDREGVVGKVYVGKFVNFFKEKNEKPPKVKRIGAAEDSRNELPDSEIYGAVSKVLADIGTEKFHDAGTAMPVIAKYVKAECEKHGCNCTRSLFTFYKQKLEDLKHET